jgi:hypothetical protein
MLLNTKIQKKIKMEYKHRNGRVALHETLDVTRARARGRDHAVKYALPLRKVTYKRRRTLAHLLCPYSYRHHLVL